MSTWHSYYAHQTEKRAVECERGHFFYPNGDGKGAPEGGERSLRGKAVAVFTGAQGIILCVYYTTMLYLVVLRTAMAPALLDKMHNDSFYTTIGS